MRLSSAAWAGWDRTVEWVRGLMEVAQGLPEGGLGETGKRVTVTVEYDHEGKHHTWRYPMTLRPERGDVYAWRYDTPVEPAEIQPWEVLQRLQHTGERVVSILVVGHVEDDPAYTCVTQELSS